MTTVICLLDELKRKLDSCTLSTKRLEQYILDHEKIFITGAGRSGLVGEFFAMRLMHIGKQVFVAGDVTTPKIQKGDLLIAITGSGSTSTVVAKAKIAKSVDATVIALTTRKEPIIKSYSDELFVLNMRSKCAKEEMDNLMPLGTAFELSALLTLEATIANLMKSIGIDENFLREHHTNLE